MKKKIWNILKDTFFEWHKDNVILLAGALSFFAVFSIVPILIITIAVTGQILGEQRAQAEIIRQIAVFLSPQTAAFFRGMLGSASHPGAGLASIFSFGILVFIGTRVFHQLYNALGIIWKTDAKTKNVFKNEIKAHLLSFLMMIGVGCFFLLFFVLDASFQTIHGMLIQYFPQLKVLIKWNWISKLVPLSLFAAFCGMAYRYVPRAGVKWRDVWLGVIVVTLLFFLGRLLFTAYFRFGDISSIYGAAGSIIVVLIWIYFVAQIFLFGAEFTWVFAHQFGSRSEKTNP